MVPLQRWPHVSNTSDLVLVDSGCLVDVKMSETSEAWLPFKLTSTVHMHVLFYLSGLGRLAGLAYPLILQCSL